MSRNLVFYRQNRVRWSLLRKSCLQTNILQRNKRYLPGNTYIPNLCWRRNAQPNNYVQSYRWIGRLTRLVPSRGIQPPYSPVCFIPALNLNAWGLYPFHLEQNVRYEKGGVHIFDILGSRLNLRAVKQIVTTSLDWNTIVSGDKARLLKISLFLYCNKKPQTRHLRDNFRLRGEIFCHNRSSQFVFQENS